MAARPENPTMPGKTLHRPFPMTSPTSSLQSAARLESLKSYGIVGTGNEPQFDDIVRLASHACQAPIASITFVDGDRQFYKARVGVDDGHEAPLDAGFCPITVENASPLVIHDTLKDGRYAANVMVQDVPFVRAYAGVPLRSPEGHVLGTVCILADEPRDFGDEELSVLQTLARQVETILRLRRLTEHQAHLLREQDRLRRSEQQFHALADNIAQLAWMADASGEVIWRNRRWYEYTGTPVGQHGSDDWQNVHPDHVSSVTEGFRRHVQSGEPWEDLFPLRGADGTYRWFLCRAFPTHDPARNVVLWCGTNTDVTEQREAAARQRRFLREMLLGFTDGRLRLCDAESELPVPYPKTSDPIELIPSTVRLLRKEAETVATALGIPEERSLDLGTATGEAAMNAVRHGGGGIGRVYGNTETGAVQVWITDKGPGIAEEMIHRAVERGWTTGGFGQGFFLMRSCADRVYLLTGEQGTTVVIEQEQQPSPPAWLWANVAEL